MSVATTKRDYYEVLGVSQDRQRRRDQARLPPAGDEVPPRPADATASTRPRPRPSSRSAPRRTRSCPTTDKRRRYDQFGHAGVSGQHDFSHMDIGDIFSMFGRRDLRRRPGRGGGAAAPAGSAGFDLETQVELTLQEVAAGAEKTIEFEKQDLCDTCKGSGAKPGSSPVVCVQCGGQGRVAQQGFGGMFRMVTTCPNCRGRGTVVRDHCPTCGGSGRQMQQRIVTVKIPAGVHEGQAVRIAGEGEPGEGGGAARRPALLHQRQAAPDLHPAQQRPGLPGADLLHPGRPGRDASRCRRSRAPRTWNPRRHPARRGVQAQGQGPARPAHLPHRRRTGADPDRDAPEADRQAAATAQGVRRQRGRRTTCRSARASWTS